MSDSPLCYWPFSLTLSRARLMPFCSRPCLVTLSRPRLGPFLFPVLPSDPVPATFSAVFVPGPAL